MLCACFPLLTFAQINSWTDDREEEIMKERERRNPEATLYEFGQQITSCECNFENLYRNWTDRFITNFRETLILSYEYVETIMDSVRLNYYAMQSDTSLIHSVGSTHSGHDIWKDSVFVHQYIYAYRLFYAHTLGQEFQRMFSYESDSLKMEYEEYREKILREHAQVIHIGDKVYMIKLFINKKLYNHYVVCNSQSHRIVFDNLFDFKIPVSNIRLY